MTRTGADLLSEPQAAEYLHQQPRTVRLWRAKRGLPHLKVTNKVVLYRRAELDLWLNRFRTVGPVERTPVVFEGSRDATVRVAGLESNSSVGGVQ